MTMKDQVQNILEVIGNRYDPEHDLVGDVTVTWTDEQLTQCIKHLWLRVVALEDVAHTDTVGEGLRSRVHAILATHTITDAMPLCAKDILRELREALEAEPKRKRPGLRKLLKRLEILDDDDNWDFSRVVIYSDWSGHIENKDQEILVDFQGYEDLLKCLQKLERLK